jgi:hypothetical protein
MIVLLPIVRFPMLIWPSVGKIKPKWLLLMLILMVDGCELREWPPRPAGFAKLYHQDGGAKAIVPTGDGLTSK